MHNMKHMKKKIHYKNSSRDNNKFSQQGKRLLFNNDYFIYMIKTTQKIKQTDSYFSLFFKEIYITLLVNNVSIQYVPP